MIERLESRRLFSSGTLDGLLADRPEVFVPWRGGGGAALEGVYVTQTASGQDFETLAGQWNLPVDNVVDLGGGGMYGFYSAESPSVVDGWLQAYGSDLLSLDPDYTIHATATPTPNANQWYLDNTGQTIGGTTGTVGADVNAPSAWKVTTGTSVGPGVVVAVLDSGIDLNHPGLVGTIWTNWAEGGGDQDLNGFTNDVHGWNFVSNNNNVADDAGHGTAVAGTISANGSVGGVYGVSPNVQILPVKILDSNGSGDAIRSYMAVNYVVDLKVNHGVNIVAINASYGGVYSFNELEYFSIKAAQDAGILFVTAAGNGQNSPAVPVNNDNQFQVAIGDGDFEQLATTNSSGWSGTNAVIDSTFPRSGSRYGLVKDGATGNLRQTITNLLPSTTYTISLYARTYVGTGAYRVRVTTDVSGFSVMGTTGSFNNTAYAQRQVSFTTGTSQYSAVLWFEKTTAADYAMVDDVTISGAEPNARYPFPANYGFSGAMQSGKAALGNVISVAATDNQDALASFSNYGASSVHVAAPGVDIYTTLLGGSTGFVSGTSFAAPIVAGILALEASTNPYATMSQLKSALLGSVDMRTSLSGKVSTGGRVNAAKALAAISLVKNSGFENASLLASDWTPSGTWSLVTTGTNTDQRAIKLGGGSTGTSGIQQTINGLEANTKYVVSAWVKVDAGQTATLSAGGTSVTATSTAGAYIPIRLTFTSGASTSATINLSCLNMGAAAVYADDVTIALDPMSGSRGITKTGTDTLILDGAYVNTGPIRIMGGTLQFSNTTGTITASTISNKGTLSFVSSNNVTVTSAISGTGSLTQGGSGTLVLSASNTYTGSTTVLTGTLKLANPSAVGFAGVAVAAGGVLDLNGQSISASHALTLNGTGISGTGALINSSSNDATWAGSVTLATASTIGGTGNITIGGIVSGSWALTKVSAGWLTLSGNNSGYNGAINLNGGYLIPKFPYSLATGAGAGAISFANGGALMYPSDGSNTTDYSGRFSNAPGQQYIIHTNGQTVTVAASLTSAGGTLTKYGFGTLTLTGTNTYTGTTTVQNGIMQLGNGATTGSLASTSVVVNQTSASLALNRSDDVTFGFSVSGPGSLTMSGAGIATLSVANTYSGPTNINGGHLIPAVSAALGTGTISFGGGTLMYPASGNVIDYSPRFSTAAGQLYRVNTNVDTVTVTFSANLAGGASATLFKEAPGTLILTGTNSFTGATTVRNGSLQIGNGSTTGWLASTNIIVDLAQAKLVLNRSDSQIYAFNISGLGSLTKNGSGAATLTASNTYTGGTTLIQGTLNINSPSAIGSGALTINGAATIDNSSGAAIALANANPLVLNANLTFAGTAGLTVGTVSGGPYTLTKSGTATFVVANVRTAGLAVNAGTLQIAADGTDNGVSVVKSLTIGSTAKLDLFNNSLVYDYTGTSPWATVRDALNTGRTMSGSWTGPGIMSSSAVADPDHITAIGYIEASDLLGLTGTQTATWAGQTVDATSLLLKQTIYGDGDLNGHINGDDYARLDAAFANPAKPRNWLWGDFNYSGTIGAPDYTDYLLVDTAYVQQVNGTSASAASATAASLISQHDPNFGADYVADLFAALPDVYVSRDVGSPSIAGSTTIVNAGTEYILTAGGTDLVGMSDQFRFAYRVVDGDFDFAVHIASLEGLDPNHLYSYAAAGLMARTSLDPDAASLMVGMDMGGDQYWSIRGADGEDAWTSYDNLVSTSSGLWVRIRRVGQYWTTYISGDGLNWLVAYQNMDLGADPVYVGMEVTSGDASYAVSASFDNLTAGPGQDAVIEGTANDDFWYGRRSGNVLLIWDHQPTSFNDPNDLPAMTLPLAAPLASLRFNGDAGNDTVILDFGGGVFALACGVTFDGGGGIDHIQVVGTTGDDYVELYDNGYLFGNNEGWAGISTAGVEDQVYASNGGSDVININSSRTIDYDLGADSPVGINAYENTAFTATQHISYLYVSANMQVVSQTQPVILFTDGLGFGWQDVLDLNDNYLVVDYDSSSPLTALRQALASGFNGGMWSGYGIISSLAAASGGLTAVAYVEASSLGLTSVSGESVDSTAVVLQYALAGDANLDGVVDLADFNAVSNNWMAANVDWAHGDLNYDGVVNQLDLNIVLAHYGLMWADV